MFILIFTCHFKYVKKGKNNKLKINRHHERLYSAFNHINGCL